MDENNMKEADELTTKEMSRLIDWLKEHGHTFEEIEDCIDTISQEKKKDNRLSSNN